MFKKIDHLKRGGGVYRCYLRVSNGSDMTIWSISCTGCREVDFESTFFVYAVP